MVGLPQRLVLEGVPRVSFYEGGPLCPEDIILPSVMRAVLEYLDEPDFGCKHLLAATPNAKILCTYAFLVGVSGAAAFLSWKEGWAEDNLALAYISPDPTAAEGRVLEAVGYTYEIVDREPERDSEATFRCRIAESLRRGVPVIGYGVVGPPEPVIIAGYEEGGEVVLGWSFFQGFPEFSAGLEFEPAGTDGTAGYFRKRKWFEDTERLLIIGERRDRPPLSGTIRDALRWLVWVTRTPMVRPEPEAPEQYQRRHNGLAAYTAWADHLRHDDEFPADDTTLRARHQIHDSAVGAVAESRWYGALFLSEAAEVFAAGPDRRGTAADVLHAAACYGAEHDLMWELWELAGGIGAPEAYRALGEPRERRAMAELVERARDEDERAAAHLEQALGGG